MPENSDQFLHMWSGDLNQQIEALLIITRRELVRHKGVFKENASEKDTCA